MPNFAVEVLLEIEVSCKHFRGNHREVYTLPLLPLLDWWKSPKVPSWQEVASKESILFLLGRSRLVTLELFFFVRLAKEMRRRLNLDRLAY